MTASLDPKLPEFDEELGSLPVPEYWMEDEDVEGTEFNYSTRAATDWIISGPLASGTGPGRRFITWKQAEAWARGFYGTRLRGRVPEAATEGHNRWAFLIAGNRTNGADKGSGVAILKRKPAGSGKES